MGRAREVVAKLGPLVGLAALFLGVALGSIFPTELSPVGEGVRAVFGFVADAAPYVIFFTLVPAVLGMLSTGSAARFALWASVAFVVATALSGILAILVLVPLFRLELIAGGGSVVEALRAVGVQTVLLAHTSPPFIAIWYGTLVALFLHFGAKWKPLAWFARPTGQVITKVGVDGVEVVGKGFKIGLPAILLAIGVFIPTNVGSAVGSAQRNLSGLAAVGGANPVVWYFLSVAVLVVILAILVLAGTAAVCWYTGFSFKRFFRDYFAYVYPFAWATASSAATIPINLDRAKDGLGVRKEVRDFIIPLGATVNLDGTMVGAFVLTVISGILVGYTPTALDLVVLVLPLTLVSIGVPGIPGGMSAVAPPVIVAILPIPLAAQAAFIAVFFAFGIGLSDQFRTGVNSCNNGLLCVLFEHWYPKRFEKPALEVLATAETTRTVPVEGPRAPQDEPRLRP